MKKKLSLFYSLILILATSLLLAFGVVFSKNALLDEAKSNTVAITHAYKSAFTGDTTSLVVEDPNIRETIILSDGSVLWDSLEQADQLESHAEREEFVAAIEGNPKTVVRSSNTLGVEFIYYAETKEISGTTYVIRVAMKTSSLTSFLTSYIPWIILVGLLCIAASIAMVILVTSASLKPLNQLNQNLHRIESGQAPDEVAIRQNDEIGKLARGINEVGASLFSTLSSLEKEEKKLSLLLSSIPNPIFATGKGGEVVFENKASSSLFPSASFPSFQEGEAFSKDGKTYLVSVAEAEDYSLFVLNDITPQKEAEKERKEFFDAASHELKTPLTSILGFNELISLSSKEEKVKEYSEKISLSSKQMLSLVQDMLALSRLEDEKKEESLPPLPLRPVAESVLEEFSLLAEEKEVALSLSGDGEAKVSEKDAALIMKNLLENAILYNVPRGKAEIILSPGSIEVKDNGIGIAKEDQSRIFARFYRVDKSRSKESGGTGLGLAIVKHAAMKYGGKIKVESRLGYGTSIRIDFD